MPGQNWPPEDDEEDWKEGEEEERDANSDKQNYQGGRVVPKKCQGIAQVVPKKRLRSKGDVISE